MQDPEKATDIRGSIQTVSVLLFVGAFVAGSLCVGLGVSAQTADNSTYLNATLNTTYYENGTDSAGGSGTITTSNPDNDDANAGSGGGGGSVVVVTDTGGGGGGGGGAAATPSGSGGGSGGSGGGGGTLGPSVEGAMDTNVGLPDTGSPGFPDTGDGGAYLSGN